MKKIFNKKKVFICWWVIALLWMAAVYILAYKKNTFTITFAIIMSIVLSVIQFITMFLTNYEG